MGDKERALEFYQQTLLHNPDFAPALNNLAYALCRIGRPARRKRWTWLFALTAANRKIRAILDTLGYIFLATGDSRTPAACLEKAAAMLPDVPTVHYHLALAYERQGRQRRVDSCPAAGHRSWTVCRISPAKSLLKKIPEEQPPETYEQNAADSFRRGYWLWPCSSLWLRSAPGGRATVDRRLPWIESGVWPFLSPPSWSPVIWPISLLPENNRRKRDQSCCAIAIALALAFVLLVGARFFSPRNGAAAVLTLVSGSRPLRFAAVHSFIAAFICCSGFPAWPKKF